MAEMHPLTRPLGPFATREERIGYLKSYFTGFLVEDPVDGTSFDCAVLDALDQVALEYPEPIDPPVIEDDEWSEPEGEEEEERESIEDGLPL